MTRAGCSEHTIPNTLFRTCSEHPDPLRRFAVTRTHQRRTVRTAAPHDRGGGERDRTDDLLLAKQALSQLSYTPLLRSPRGARPTRATCLGMPLVCVVSSNTVSDRPLREHVVGLDGFEPSTPALSRRCSNQLSYRPSLDAYRPVTDPNNR